MNTEGGARDPLRVVRARPGGQTEPAVDSGAEDAQRTRRVAAILPARNEAAHVAATVRAVRAIPNVDLVIVVDDGSVDDTQHAAREAGAVVVRHSQTRGKAAAMETGAAVAAMRDAEGQPPRLLLFLDADLGDTAVNAAALVPPVLAGRADLSIGVLPQQEHERPGGHAIVTGLARRAVNKVSGWTPKAPLSGQRCLTREAFEAALPLARGFGVETGMTIDLLERGFAVVEVPCDVRHVLPERDLAGLLNRANQYRDIAYAIAVRRVRRY